MPGGNPFPLPFLARRLRDSRPADNAFVILHARTCNRSCDFCYIQNMEWGQTPFDVALINEALASTPSPRLGFAGGEPFNDKEAVEIFLATAHKWAPKLQAITILSNMDYWHKYEDRVREIPMAISVVTNDRAGRVYPSSGNVRIWNKIFVDEIGKFEFKTGPEYYYFFVPKKPTFLNDMQVAPPCDIFEVINLADRLWEAGCWVALTTRSHFRGVHSHRSDYLDPFHTYVNKIVFPVGWKDGFESLSEICTKCGLGDKECVAAIEADKCPRLNKACFYCDKHSECTVPHIDERIVDKGRIPDCSLYKALMDLGLEYRARWVKRTGVAGYVDPNPWKFPHE